MESKNSAYGVQEFPWRCVISRSYQQVLSVAARNARNGPCARARVWSPGSPGGATLWLESAAAMYTLLTGLEGSMPHLPVYADRTSAYTTVEHPGYTE